MLYLLVRLGGDDYAIEAGSIQQVVPFARLKGLPPSLPETAGMLNYHGRAVPVIDLARLATGKPCRTGLNTRIILANVQASGSPSRLLGLLVEEARSVARFEPGEFQPTRIHSDGAAWLGPVAEYDGRLVQRINITQLLPAHIMAALSSDAESALVP